MSTTSRSTSPGGAWGNPDVRDRPALCGDRVRRLLPALVSRGDPRPRARGASAIRSRDRCPQLPHLRRLSSGHRSVRRSVDHAVAVGVGAQGAGSRCRRVGVGGGGRRSVRRLRGSFCRCVPVRTGRRAGRVVAPPPVAAQCRGQHRDRAAGGLPLVPDHTPEPELPRPVGAPGRSRGSRRCRRWSGVVGRRPDPVRGHGRAPASRSGRHPRPHPRCSDGSPRSDRNPRSCSATRRQSSTSPSHDHEVARSTPGPSRTPARTQPAPGRVSRHHPRPSSRSLWSWRARRSPPSRFPPISRTPVAPPSSRPWPAPPSSRPWPGQSGDARRRRARRRPIGAAGGSSSAPDAAPPAPAATPSMTPLTVPVQRAVTSTASGSGPTAAARQVGDGNPTPTLRSVPSTPPTVPPPPPAQTSGGGPSSSPPLGADASVPDPPSPIPAGELVVARSASEPAAQQPDQPTAVGPRRQPSSRTRAQPSPIRPRPSRPARMPRWPVCWPIARRSWNRS